MEYHHGLRGAAFLACGPSLERAARQEPQTLDTAREVDRNLQELAYTIVTGPNLGAASAQRQAGEAKTANLIAGQNAEIGVLGLIWRRIAEGDYDERLYALPVSKDQDIGTRKDGYNLATDILIRKSGVKGRRRVQVKASLPVSEEKRTRVTEDYYPGTVMAVLSDLMGGRHPENPQRLLSLLATGDKSQLEPVQTKLQDSFQQAGQRAEQYFRQRGIATTKRRYYTPLALAA